MLYAVIKFIERKTVGISCRPPFMMCLYPRQFLMVLLWKRIKDFVSWDGVFYRNIEMLSSFRISCGENENGFHFSYSVYL